MTPSDIDRVFGRGRLQMVTGAHVEVFREEALPGERRRYTKRFLSTAAGDFRHWTEREWRILARLVGHGIGPVPDVVQYDRGVSGGKVALVQTYDAGITVDHWATLLPVQRDGPDGPQRLQHVFEDCAHWWALARHSLIALDAIHEIGLVHLDLKADNVCVPFGPADFDPLHLDPSQPSQALLPRFEQIALIDFAFSLVSGEQLLRALPIARQTEYDYQSPRLLAALEAGSAGDLAPTRALDWRCDLFSLAAMLRRYLPDPEAAPAHGWTRARDADARALVRRLLQAHDAELPLRRPHAELYTQASLPLADPALAQSLERGWTLDLQHAVGTAVSPTPVTRIALPIEPSVMLADPAVITDLRELPAGDRRPAAMSNRRRWLWGAGLVAAAVLAIPALGEAWLSLRDRGSVPGEAADMAAAPPATDAASAAPAPPAVIAEVPATAVAPGAAASAAEAPRVVEAVSVPAPAPAASSPAAIAPPPAAPKVTAARLPAARPVSPAPAAPSPAARDGTRTAKAGPGAAARLGSAPRPATPALRPGARPAPASPPARSVAKAPAPTPRVTAPAPRYAAARPTLPAAAQTPAPTPARVPPTLPPWSGPAVATATSAPGAVSAPLAMAAPAAVPAPALPAPRAEPPPTPSPRDATERAEDLIARQLPRMAQRAERLVLRVLVAAADDEDDDLRSAARAIRLAPGDSQLEAGSSPSEARSLNEAARAAYWRRGDLREALALQMRAFGANPLDAEVAGNLAFLRLKQQPNQPEQARQLALHALTTHDPRHPQGRIEDWTTLAITNSLTGRERDARNAWLVTLELAPQADRQCRAAVNAYAQYGERVRTAVEAMLQRASQRPRAERAPMCEWPPHWQLGSSGR